jgi:hypothetical protein
MSCGVSTPRTWVRAHWQCFLGYDGPSCSLAHWSGQSVWILCYSAPFLIMLFSPRCANVLFMLISFWDAPIHAYQSEKNEIAFSPNDPFFQSSLSGRSLGSCQNTKRYLLDLPVLCVCVAVSATGTQNTCMCGG